MSTLCAHMCQLTLMRDTQVCPDTGKNILVWQVAKNTKCSVFDAFIHRVIINWQTYCCSETDCTVDDVFHDGNERVILIGAVVRDMTSHVE